MSIINDSIAAVNGELNQLHHMIGQLESKLESVMGVPVITPEFDKVEGVALFEQELCHTRNSASHARQRIQDIILRLRV